MYVYSYIYIYGIYLLWYLLHPDDISQAPSRWTVWTGKEALSKVCETIHQHRALGRLGVWSRGIFLPNMVSCTSKQLGHST